MICMMHTISITEVSQETCSDNTNLTTLDSKLLPLSHSLLSSPRGGRGRNPRDSRGNVTHCDNCESTNHMGADCPDKVSHSIRLGRSSSQPRQTFFEQYDEENYVQGNVIHDTYYEVVLFQSDYNHPSHLKGPVVEAVNAGVLDSGANKTVCGQTWFNIYLNSLTPSDSASITT